MAVEGAKVITSKAILSYPNLLVARAGKGANAKAKFSGALVWTPELIKTPDGAKCFDAMKKAVLAAAESKFGTKAAEMFRIKSLRTPFRDDAEAKGYPAGSIFLNVRTEQKPACVFAYAGPDGKPQRMTDEEIKVQMYPGALVRASIVAFPYEAEGNKGVSFALNNLQKVGEGERIDGRQAAEDEFDVDLSAAPASIDGLI
jgi:Protein of unknown function (DUF2815).